MTRGQIITKLRREGYAVTVGRVRQALKNGYVLPLPGKNTRGAYDFQPEHLRQLRWYLVHVAPGPRPLFPRSVPIRGSNDRVRRLEQKKREIDVQRAMRLDRLRRQKAAQATICWLEEIESQLAG